MSSMTTSFRTQAKLAVAVVSAVALLAPEIASAASIKVTTANDEFNANPGACSLREAIWSANHDLVLQAPGCTPGSGADEITLPAGVYNLTIPGAGEQGNASGDLDLTAPVTIGRSGGGSAVVDAKGLDRVFEVNTPGGASVTISNLTIRGGNAAAGANGGGILNTAGTLNLFGSTLADNTSSNYGGGIETRPGATSNLVNSTISGNTADIDGGGIDNTGATTTLLNVTVTANTADADGNNTGQAGGVGNFGGTTMMRSTLLGANVDRGGQSPDCFNSAGATLASQGQTLIGSVLGCSYAASTGDITGIDAKLGPLADNGGPTPTHALLTGSPALGKGAGCAKTDQRGVPRTAGGACDIGAYELVRCHGRVANRIGTNGSDTLRGGRGADVFLLLGGSDRAFGRAGNDVICGGAGDDHLFGGPGRDRLYGDTGKDKLIGGTGNDLLVGGGGRDKLRGGFGKDRLRGEGGKDICEGGNGGGDRAAGCEREKEIP